MKVKNITAQVLEVLFNVAEDFADIAVNRDSAWRVLYQIDKKYEWTGTKLGRWVRDLNRNDLIIIEKHKNKESIKITNKGKLKIVEAISKSKKRESNTRLISFDIPEYMKIQRNQFRRVIKRLGFKQLQQSLWVIDRDVSELVEIAALEYGVSDYVIYIIAEKTNADRFISKL